MDTINRLLKDANDKFNKFKNNAGGEPGDKPGAELVPNKFGGRRGRRRSSSKKRSKTLKGGSAVIGAALLPFGLLGLQKYIQSRKYSRGSSSSTRRRTSRSARRKSALKLSEEPV